VRHGPGIVSQRSPPPEQAGPSPPCRPAQIAVGSALRRIVSPPWRIVVIGAAAFRRSGVVGRTIAWIGPATCRGHRPTALTPPAPRPSHAARTRSEMNGFSSVWLHQFPENHDLSGASPQNAPDRHSTVSHTGLADARVSVGDRGENNPRACHTSLPQEPAAQRSPKRRKQRPSRLWLRGAVWQFRVRAPRDVGRRQGARVCPIMVTSFAAQWAFASGQPSGRRRFLGRTGLQRPNANRCRSSVGAAASCDAPTASPQAAPDRRRAGAAGSPCSRACSCDASPIARENASP
jgi:hypothetical protein